MCVNTKGIAVLRGGVVKDGSDFQAVIKEQALRTLSGPNSNFENL